MSDIEHGGEAWRGRRMIGGRWRASTDDNPGSPRADRVIAVKLTEAELAEFDARIAELDLKRNRALRIAARRIGGFVELDTAALAELRDAVRQIGGVARNINQIARAANRTHDPNYRAFMAERAALGREMARLEGLLQRLLDLGTRRTDGLSRLREAAER